MTKDIPLADLRAHDRNYNQHSDAQIAKIAKSLATFGQVRSIVVWHNTILAGHGVVMAAKSLGWDTIRADRIAQDHLTESQALAYVVADNELARQSDPDQAQLAAILEELQAREPLLVEAAGYSSMELEQLLRLVNPKPVVDSEPQIDRAAELQKKWGTSTGQLWALGADHRLICGDCTDAAVAARVMGGECFDLVLTSPPYNSGDGGYKPDYYGKTKRFYQEDTDDRTELEWIEFCENVLCVCGQHAADDNSVVVWNVMYTANCRSGYGQVLFGKRQPFTVKETICWDKGHGFPTASKGILSRNWELIFVLSKGEKYNTTQGDNEPRWAKWDIGRPNQQGENHRATFPLELAVKAIGDFSFDDSFVYDPFAGSSTPASPATIWADALAW